MLRRIHLRSRQPPMSGCSPVDLGLQHHSDECREPTVSSVRGPRGTRRRTPSRSPSRRGLVKWDDVPVAEYDPSEVNGLTVSRVALDWQVRLLLDDLTADRHGSWPTKDLRSGELVIEADFDLWDTRGEHHRIRPGKPETLAPLLRLLHQVVNMAIYDGALLKVSFRDGHEVRVSSDSKYEAWGLSGTNLKGWIATKSDHVES